MITCDELLALATAADNAIATLREMGATDPISDLRHTREQALNAAKWLEDQGLTEAHQVGNFGDDPLIKKGVRVKVKKGTKILSMHPRYSRDNPRIAGRDHIVTVYDVYQGYVQSHWHPHEITGAVRNRQIVYPGEGGYWCHIDTALVEFVDG